MESLLHNLAGILSDQTLLSNSLIAFLAGTLPCLLWLAFWLLEDSRHPEPRRYILLTFIAGMLVVPVAAALQQSVLVYVPLGSLAAIFLWALIEEGLKFLAAGLSALRNRWNDEPVDALVYLITAALGYAALENTLFIFGPLDNGEIGTSIVAGNFRFIGSTLVHVLSSGVIGIFLAYSFCRPWWKKIGAIIAGLMCATGLHLLYNLLILKTEVNFFIIFTGIWIGIVCILAIFELVKRLNPYCRIR